MGLSSSQGRLLMLTSRLSDIELAQIMISQRQNQLAWESEKISKEYNEAMSNYKLTIKVPDASENKGFTIEDLSYENMSELGYLITDAQNRVYIRKDENGQWVVPTDADGNQLIKIDNDSNTATIGGKTYELVDGTNYYKNKQLLQNSIMNGLLYVFNTETSKEGISLSTLESDTEVQWVLDTSDDAKAQSLYDYETAKISRQDNRLDMDMQQLETQHEAVSKEYDSVKEVIKSNVDRTFKLFSKG